MKRILSAFLLTLSLATQAGLPPTSSKISGESVYSTTFKTDFGTFKGTRSGTTLTLNSIGAGVGDSLALGGTIDANAVIDVQSTTKAAMLPRMTTSQKNAITPVAGMELYDNILNIKQYYNGTKWVGFGDPATSAIAATTIDWSVLISNGGLYTKTLSANTTFTFSNLTAGQVINVRLTNTASNYTVTWPTVKWSAGTTPTMTVGAKSDIYSFFYDGTDIFGAYIQNY